MVTLISDPEIKFEDIDSRILLLLFFFIFQNIFSPACMMLTQYRMFAFILLKLQSSGIKVFRGMEVLLVTGRKQIGYKQVVIPQGY